MTRSGNVVTYPMPRQVLLEALVDEVRTSVTYHYPWNSESWKNYFFKHLFWMYTVSIPAWHGINPLGDIIQCHQDIFILLWRQKWPHIVNPADTKELYLGIADEWHGIPWIDITMSLARATSPNKFSCVFIHCRLEESILPYLGLCSKRPIMPSIWWWMPSFNYFDSFFS